MTTTGLRDLNIDSDTDNYHSNSDNYEPTIDNYKWTSDNYHSAILDYLCCSPIVPVAPDSVRLKNAVQVLANKPPIKNYNEYKNIKIYKYKIYKEIYARNVTLASCCVAYNIQVLSCLTALEYIRELFVPVSIGDCCALQPLEIYADVTLSHLNSKPRTLLMYWTVLVE